MLLKLIIYFIENHLAILLEENFRTANKIGLAFLVHVLSICWKKDDNKIRE